MKPPRLPLKREIARINAEHPGWTTAEIATELSTSAAYVGQVANAIGLTIPRKARLRDEYIARVQICVQFEKADLDRIRDQADEIGWSAAALIRARVLGERIPTQRVAAE